MAKLHDKFFNRVIEGEISDLTEKDGQEIDKVASGAKLCMLHFYDTQHTFDFYLVVEREDAEFSKKHLNDFGFDTIIRGWGDIEGESIPAIYTFSSEHDTARFDIHVTGISADRKEYASDLYYAIEIPLNNATIDISNL